MKYQGNYTVNEQAVRDHYGEDDLHRANIEIVVLNELLKMADNELTAEQIWLLETAIQNGFLEEIE